MLVMVQPLALQLLRNGVAAGASVSLSKLPYGVYEELPVLLLPPWQW